MQPPLSHDEGEVSWVFSNCGRNLGYILELQRWQFTHTRSFFLAPPPSLSNCSGVSPNQGFELGCENQPKSGPGSALSVQDVCEDPVGTPEARGWGVH